MSIPLWRQRRERVLARLGGGVLVLPAAPVFRRNGDSDHVYRQESDLLYLTGFPEPESVLVLHPALEKKATLFVRPRHKEEEIWTGRRAGVEGALRDYGVDQAFVVDDFDKELPKLLQGAQTLYYPLGWDGPMDEKVLGHFARLRRRARQQQVPERIEGLERLVHELRLVKDETELATLARAAELTRDGFLRALAATRPGRKEYEIEAELLYAYRKGGGTGPGYEPIVAAGVNATILHYRTGRDTLQDGELLLIDSGCEVDGYTADVTRTWPANGRFSRAQQALYEVVLAAHLAAIDAVRPGASRDSVHEVACRALVRGLLDLKLLEGTESEAWEKKTFRRFYPHATSHWLGLDVHDAGAYYPQGAPRPYGPGMVLTIEPGLYVQPDDEKAPAEYRGIGIRIEDDVLVTRSGRQVLTDAIPRTVEELARVQQG